MSKSTKATSSTKVTSEVLNAGEKGVDRAIKKIMSLERIFIKEKNS